MATVLYKIKAYQSQSNFVYRYKKYSPENWLPTRTLENHSIVLFDEYYLRVILKLPVEHEEAAQEETAILSAGKQLLDIWFQEQDESARHALHVVFIRHESSKIICKI